MPYIDRRAQLIKEITNLKKDLNRAYKKRKSLIHPEILAISMQLDVKILQYTKINNMAGNEEIVEQCLSKIGK